MHESSLPSSALSLKKIFRLGSVYGLTPILDKAVALALLPVFTRYLSTDGYGSLVLFYAFANILQLLFFMGYPDSLQKLYWDYNDEERKTLFGTAWIFNVGMNVLLAVPLITFSGSITGVLLKNDRIGLLFVLVIAKILLSTQTIIPFVILRAKEQKFTILKVNLISIFVRVGLTLFLLIYLRLDLVGIFLADIGTSFVIQFIYLPILMKEIRFSFKPVYLKEILTLSPFQFSIEILAWIIALSDRMIIQLLLESPSQVGIYAVAYTFGNAILFLTNPVLSAWRPHIYSVSSENRMEYQKQMGDFFIYFIAACCASFLILAAVTPDCIRILTPPVYHGAVPLVTIILIANVLAAVSNYFLPPFFVAKRLQWVVVVYAFSAAVNVVLNLLLIPKMGIMGAAVATTISYGIMVSMLYVESRKLIELEVNFGAIITLLLLTVIAYCLLKNVSATNQWLSLMIKCLVLAPILTICAFCLNKSRISPRPGSRLA